jgi:hypothetical protein
LGAPKEKDILRRPKEAQIYLPLPKIVYKLFLKVVLTLDKKNWRGMDNNTDVGHKIKHTSSGILTVTKYNHRLLTPSPFL